jgi:hypothetical protein
MLQIFEINSLTTYFWDIRRKRRKSAISTVGGARESREILDFRDPFLPRNESGPPGVPAGLFQAFERA